MVASLSGTGGYAERALAGAPSPPDVLVALTREALDEAAAGRLTPVIGQEWGLEDAATAHAALEARATIGTTLLVPAR